MFIRILMVANQNKQSGKYIRRSLQLLNIDLVIYTEDLSALQLLGYQTSLKNLITCDLRNGQRQCNGDLCSAPCVLQHRVSNLEEKELRFERHQIIKMES